MNSIFFRRVSIVSGACALIGLSACGGGGDAAPAVSPPAVQPNTQATAVLVAKLALVTVEGLSGNANAEQAFFANFLKAVVNSSTGGSSSGGVPASCATGNAGGGTFGFTVTKVASYPGLRVGDSVSITFTNCNFGANPLTLNGTAVLTAQASYSVAPAYPLPDAFRLQYQLSTSNFEFITSVQKFRSNGIQIVDYNATAAGTGFPEINVASGQTQYSVAIFSPPTSALPTVGFSLKPTATIYSKLSLGNGFVSGVSGNVDVTGSSGVVPLTLQMNTRLAGSNVAGRSIPVSGDFSAKENVLNLQTRTLIQGLNATIQADLNRDGVVDSTSTVSVFSLTN